MRPGVAQGVSPMFFPSFRPDISLSKCVSRATSSVVELARYETRTDMFSGRQMAPKGNSDIPFFRSVISDRSCIKPAYPSINRARAFLSTSGQLLR